MTDRKKALEALDALYSLALGRPDNDTRATEYIARQRNKIYEALSEPVMRVPHCTFHDEDNHTRRSAIGSIECVCVKCAIMCNQPEQPVIDDGLPLGAIENGREFFRRLTEHYDFQDSCGHKINNCYEFEQLRICFETLVTHATKGQSK